MSQQQSSKYQENETSMYSLVRNHMFSRHVVQTLTNVLKVGEKIWEQTTICSARCIGLLEDNIPSVGVSNIYDGEGKAES